MPDIENDEDVFAECGQILIIGETVKIDLFERFIELCEGEIYQRREFVRAILVEFCQFNIYFSLTTIFEITDMTGFYSGFIDEIDDRNYSF